MEIAFSSSRVNYEGKDDGMEALIKMFLNSGNEMKSIGFSRSEFHSTALEVFPERFLLEGSVKSETRISIRSSKSSLLKMRSLESSLNMSTECPKHQAAVKLQKIYKGFQTRRRLADCAVLIEQRWYGLCSQV